MSAYIVNNETINCIVNGMVDNRVIARMDAENVGQKLLDMNVASVNYRYEENETREEFRFERKGVALEIDGVALLFASDEMYTDLQVYGCLRCWKYQSCELPDYDKWEAWRYVDTLEFKLTEKAYPDYPWGL